MIYLKVYFFNTGRSRAPPVPPETARPRQVPPTQQPPRSPAKERASQPNSSSDDFSKLPSRRRQVSFWLSGRALDSGQAKRQFKSPSLFFALASFSKEIALTQTDRPHSLSLYCRSSVVSADSLKISTQQQSGGSKRPDPQNRR